MYGYFDNSLVLPKVRYLSVRETNELTPYMLLFICIKNINT